MHWYEILVENSTVTSSVNCSRLSFGGGDRATIAIFSEIIPESFFYLRIRCDQMHDFFYWKNNVGDAIHWKGECFLYSQGQKKLLCFSSLSKRSTPLG